VSAPDPVTDLEHLAAAPAAALTATRRLQVLDELRVPYTVVPRAASAGGWHALTAGPGGGVHWYTGPETAPGGFTLGDTPIWGQVAGERVVAARAAGLPGQWRREVPILGPDGVRHSSVWHSPDGGTLLPFDPDELMANLRSERYRELGGGGGRGRALIRRAYYALKPAIPHRLQIALRRRFTRVQERVPFPRWPVEPALHDFAESILASVADAAGGPVPYLAPWPDGYDWALVLTHDVETAAGRDAIDRLREVEVTAGYRSSWNLVPERYTVEDALVAALHESGNEVGVHGLRHDGRDLASLAVLHKRLPAIRSWAERWGAVGFRAPATHRRWEWMPLLGFDYDSSYPDSDPYEPMAGGCCSWLPFFNEDQVELPVTLPQDHTLFVILRRDSRVWTEKADHLRDRGGMALIIVHPDYMLEDEPLAAYARFLDAYRHDGTVWKALPRDVSAWWRARAATSPAFAGGRWHAVGPAADRATVAFAVPGRGRVR
jgi:hypothetical protein